jgi:hypothetical protein
MPVKENETSANTTAFTNDDFDVCLEAAIINNPTLFP